MDLPFGNRGMEGVQAGGGRAPGWWGMVLLIATEATLFLYLIVANFYTRYISPVEVPGELERPELLLPVINTVILLSSSLPMHWADTGIRRGDQRRLKLGLALSFILGAVFLAIQFFEYTRLPFTHQDNVHGSFFYTITGFHGAHVAIGLLLSGITQVRAWLGHFNEQRHLAVETTAMYWHFVDVVWIAVFVSLYLA